MIVHKSLKIFLNKINSTKSAIYFCLIWYHEVDTHAWVELWLLFFRRAMWPMDLLFTFKKKRNEPVINKMHWPQGYLQFYQISWKDQNQGLKENQRKWTLIVMRNGHHINQPGVCQRRIQCIIDKESPQITRRLMIGKSGES